MTTSIPTATGDSTSDARLPLIRDAGLLVRAMARVGMTNTLDSYIGYLKNHIFKYLRVKKVFPPYSTIQVRKGDREEEAKYLAGYRGLAAVHHGIASHLRAGYHEVFGSAAYALTLTFQDCRLNDYKRATRSNFEEISQIAVLAYNSVRTSSLCSFGPRGE